MIQVNDPTIQAVIDSLKKQREEALDAVALHTATIIVRDTRIKELEDKLNQPAPASAQS